MMILVVGGSGSGKSAYAEEIALSFPAGERYYLATMQIFDEEGRRKVKKHQEARSGKGFLTIEQPVAVHRALEKMRTKEGTATALLECVSNLTANEMFREAAVRPELKVMEDVVGGIRRLSEELEYLVVVSNNVFEDGTIYDEAAMSYIRAMGKINRELAAMADQVVEVVVGIPVVIKQREAI